MANYTQHYQLHQWVPEDNFLRTDFNEDFKKIDTAIKSVETDLQANLDNEVSRLDGAITTAQQTVQKNLNTQVTRLDNAITSAKQTAQTNLNTQVTRLDSAITAAQQTVQKNLNTQVTRLDGLSDALEASKAEIFTGRYTGTGTFGTDARSFLSFSKRPTIVLLFCPTEPSINMAVLPWVSGNPVDLYATGGTYLSITWQGNTVYWWTYRNAIEQFNNSGTAYYYVAL